MLAAHPGVIEALRKAAATEQVRYRMLCYREGSVCSGKLLDAQLLHFWLLQLPVHRDHEEIDELVPETSSDPHQKVQYHTSQLMSDVNSNEHEVAEYCSQYMQVLIVTFDHGTRQEEYHFILLSS